MKPGRIITAILLAAGAAIGWHNHGVWQAARQEGEELSAALSKESSVGNPKGTSSSTARPARGDRPSVTEADELAHRLAAHLAGQRPIFTEDSSETCLKRAIDETTFKEEISRLDSPGLEAFVTALAATDHGIESGWSYLAFALNVMGERDPLAAAVWAKESQEKLKDVQGWLKFIEQESTNLWQELGRTHPEEGLKLLESQGAADGSSDQRLQRLCLLWGVASNDPLKTFAIMDELHLSGNPQAESILIRSASSLDDCSTLLGAFRQRAETGSGDSPISQNVERITKQVTAHGFEQATAWADSHLKPDELPSLVLSAANEAGKPGEAQKWLDWAGTKLDPEDAAGPAAEILNAWVRCDVEAAEKWLSAQPKGPIRDQAVRVFVNETRITFPEKAKAFTNAEASGNP